MNPIDQILEMIHEHLLHDNDFVLLVTGDEGKGKSHLVLQIIQKWYDNFFDGCKSEHAEKLQAQPMGWIKQIKKCERYGINAYDEGGRVNSRGAMSKMNKIIFETYQVIRGKNFFTIIAIPSVFDLETSFPKRRAKGLFHIPKRGIANFYGQKKLREIVEINQRKIIKKVHVRLPDLGPIFFDKYTGVMIDTYLSHKEDSMKEQLDRLYQEVEMLEGVSVDTKIVTMTKKGMKQNDIAKELGMTQSAVSHRLRKLRNA